TSTTGYDNGAQQQEQPVNETEPPAQVQVQVQQPESSRRAAAQQPPKKFRLKKMKRTVRPNLPHDELTPSDLDELIDTNKDYQIDDWYETDNGSDSEDERNSVDIVAELVNNTAEDNHPAREYRQEPARRMNDHLLPDMDMPIEDGEEEIEQGDLFAESEPGFFDGRERFIGHDYHYYYHDEGRGFVREHHITEAVGRQFGEVQMEAPRAANEPIERYEDVGYERRHRRSGNERVHPNELYTAASRAIPLCDNMRERREIAEFGEAGYCQTNLNDELQQLRYLLRRPLSRKLENKIIDRHERVMLCHILKVAESDQEEALRLADRLISPSDEFFERRKRRFAFCPTKLAFFTNGFIFS
ncbi:hypothetical protein WR25_08097, partial [Diploscapter pachys]